MLHATANSRQGLMWQSILVTLSTILFSLGMEIQELYSVGYDSLSDSIKEGKVKEDVKQAFLVYLFFINGNSKKHSQLKKTVANNMQKEMA
jgi:hypothetical protein